MRTLLVLACFCLIPAAALPASKALDMWAIDTDGGRTLLIVTPAGQSMLIDTEFPGQNDRDTSRIRVVATSGRAGESRTYTR